MLKNPRFKEGILVALLLTIVLSIAFYDVVLLGKTFKVTTGNPQALPLGVYGQLDNRLSAFPIQTTDTTYIEEGYQQFIRDSFRAGIFPLWNPHQGCGSPMVGMMHFGIFFPLNYILYLLPNIISWDILIFARLFCAGFLMYLFIRSLKFPKIPALSGAIAYMLSGPMILMQVSFANVELLTPLIFMSLELLARKPDLKRACLLTGALALCFFAGNPEHIVLINGVAFFYFCFRVFTVCPRPKRLKAFLLLLLAYAFSVGIAAIVILPFLYNWVKIFWHTHTATIGSGAEGAGVYKKALINAFFPYYFLKNPVTMNFDRISWLGYLGIVNLGLAFLSLFSRQRKNLNFFIWALVILILSKSYVNSPVLNWIGHIPLIGMIRFYIHVPQLVAFCFAILSAMGLRALLTTRKLWWPGLIYSATLIIWLAFMLWHFRATKHFALSVKASVIGLVFVLGFQTILALRRWAKFPRQLIVLALLVLLSAELIIDVPRCRAKRFNSFPEVPYIEFLKKQEHNARAYGIFWTFFPNVAMGYQVDDLGICRSLLSTRFVKYINNFVLKDYFKKGHDQKGHGKSAFWISPVTFLKDSRPFINILNVRYSIAPNNFPSAYEGIYPAAKSGSLPEPIYSDEVKIYQHNYGFPRVFIVHNAIFEPDESKVFDLMRSHQKEFYRIVILQHEPVDHIINSLAGSPDFDRSNALISEYTPNEVKIKADMKNAGLLILGDLYHPDWNVYIDGKKSEIYPADYLIRAVFLPAGEHTVVFKFEPFSFYLGMFISILCLGFYLTLIFLLSRKSS